MRLRRRLLTGAICTLASSVYADGPIGPAAPPPPVCLAPLASSCVRASKKDRHAERRTPHLESNLLTLVSIHTREAIVLDANARHDDRELVARFFRDRTSWESHSIAPGCLATMRAACQALNGRRVEVVSGFRSEKLNEMLRKKGHHVARRSQHTQGNAVDFRIVGVEEPVLYRFVRRAHVGGVGRYPDSAFVHVDTGPARSWHGE